MAQTILLKRGLITNIDSVTLQKGEPAIGFDEEEKKAKLYIGGSDGKPIEISVDSVAVIAAAVQQANGYTDEQITEKTSPLTEAIEKLNDVDTVGGSVRKIVKDAINKFATEVTEDGKINTVAELFEYIEKHGSDYTALVGKVQNNETNISKLQSEMEGKAGKDEIPTTVEELSDADNYAKKTDVPTTVGELTDAGQYAKKTEVPKNVSDLADAGSYIKNTDTIDGGTF